jgi:hypothetical protein
MALALMRIKVALAQPNGAWRHLNQFIILDVCNRLFQAHFARRDQQQRLILAGGADIGQLLFLDRVHFQIIVARMFTQDHADINLDTGINEQRAAFLNVAGYNGRTSRQQQEICVQISAGGARFPLQRRRPAGQTRRGRQPGAVTAAYAVGSPIRSPLGGQISRLSRGSRISYGRRELPFKYSHGVEQNCLTTRGLHANTPLTVKKCWIRIVEQKIS